ncbi:MAG: DUF4870 domain-containing protein [Patescibacteria group bacterium]
MGNQKDVEDNKVMAAISYIWIVSLIMMLVKKDSKFVQHHAKQGFILWIASIIFWFIPVLGWILNLLVLVFVIIGFIQSLNGAWWKAPLISELAEKINF